MSELLIVVVAKGTNDIIC